MRLTSKSFLLCITFFLAVFSNWSTTPAYGHASVVATSPAHGSEWDTSPTELRVELSESVSLGGLSAPATVLDSAGNKVEIGEAFLQDSATTLIVPLPPELEQGVYIASWRAISADTHPVGGSIQFGVGTPVGVVSNLDSAPEPAAELTLTVGIVKAGVYLGIVLAYGLWLAALVLGVQAQRYRRVFLLAALGIALTVVASLAQVLTQFLWIRSTVPAAQQISASEEFVTFLTTSYAVVVWIRIAILVVAGVLLYLSAVTKRSYWPWGYTGTALATIITIVLNGHGGVASPWLFGATLLHALSATAWIGGLVLLGWIVFQEYHSRRSGLAASLPSRIGWWSPYAASWVLLVALTGIVQSISSVQFWSALFNTSYGYILLLKLVLVLIAGLLGLLGYLRLRQQRTHGLGPRIRWEAGIGVVVIVISGLLSSVTPAKDEWAPADSKSTMIGPYQVSLDIAPIRVGPQTFRLSILPPSVDAGQPTEILVTLEQQDGDVEQLPLDFVYRIPAPYSASDPASTTYISSAANIPADGLWRAQVTLIVDRYEQYSGALEYQVF